MGLDMYLSKKTYVKQWSHDKPEEQFEVSVKQGGKPFKKIESSRVSYVTEELMYWRKANQIHGWFVHNTQEIVEEVKYYVTKEDLDNLLDVCKQVLDVLSKSEIKTVQVRSGWSGGEETYSDVETYDCEDEIRELLPPTELVTFPFPPTESVVVKEVPLPPTLSSALDLLLAFPHPKTNRLKTIKNFLIITSS
jgi:hypothetical protein